MTRRLLASLVAAVSLGVAAPAMAQDFKDYYGEDDQNYDYTYEQEALPQPQPMYQHYDTAADDYTLTEQYDLRRERMIAVHSAEHQRLAFQQQRLISQGFGPGTVYYRRWQVRVARHNARFHPAPVVQHPTYSGGGGGYYRPLPAVRPPRPVRQYYPRQSSHWNIGLRVRF